MDFHMTNNHNTTNSPSSSSTSSTTLHLSTSNGFTTTTDDPMHSWWESINKARSHIQSLSSILPSDPYFSLSSLADSDRPALSLLSSLDAYSAVSAALSSPFSGSGADPLCHWLYDTFVSSDQHLRLVVLCYLPLLSGLYLSRIHSDSTVSLAGFEAVLLALYASETKLRNGKPVVVSIPDLSQSSLYHTPKNNPVSSPVGMKESTLSVGVLSPPLEPQIAVKSTKRACIVGVALDCYYKQISQMPSWSKVEFCQFVAGWAGQDCPCKSEFDQEVHLQNNGFEEIRVLGDENEIEDEDDIVNGMGKLAIKENGVGFGSKGVRIPLPWELLQPVLRILGHCLLGPLNSQDVKDAASVAVRCLYARGSHDLFPQTILATRSLIQLDRRARSAAKVETVVNSSSNATTPSKAKKPEIFLVSK